MPTRRSADLDGDGRDELLFHERGRLRACRGDLKEQWSWSTRETIREVMAASAGQPANVILNRLVLLARPARAVARLVSRLIRRRRAVISRSS